MAQPTPVTYATTYSNSYRIYLTVTPGAYNPATNSTDVTVYLVADATGAQWFSGWSCNGYLNITYTNSAGASTNLNWTENTSTSRALSGAGGFYTARTSTFTAYHNSAGLGTFTVAASYGMNNQSQSYSMPQRTISTQTYTLLSAPSAAPTVSRSVNGLTIDLTSQAASSTTTSTDTRYAITAYQYVYSTDGTTWSSPSSMTGLAATFGPSSPIVVSSTTGYYFKTNAYAANWGPYSAVTYSPGIATVPSAPSNINVTTSGSTAQVVLSASSSDGGSAITGYFVQYSRDSGSTWSTPVSASLLSYTYSGLINGTYLFRAYATNAIGNSAVFPTPPSTVSATIAVVTVPEIAPLVFDANPIYSGSFGYNQIRLQWTKPLGTWAYLTLVRSTLGFPVTPEDGTKLLVVDPTGHDNLQFPLLDPKIKPNDYPLADNQVYYYSVFVKSSASSSWIQAASTMAMSVKNYGTTDFMYNTLPVAYRVNSYNTGLVDVTETNYDLVNFLNIFAFEYDSFKAAAENVNERYNVAKLDGRLVPIMMHQLGLNYEAELGVAQGRRMLQAFSRNSIMRGTSSGLKSFVTAFSGYNCTLGAPINLMLNVDDSSFENSLGSWNDPQPVLTTLSRVTSSTTAAYQETSLADFPSLNAGCMRVVGSAIMIGNQTPTYSAPNITLNTIANHGFVAGDSVTVYGVTPSGYNGTWTAQAGTSGTALVLNIGSNPGAITSTPGYATPGVVFIHCGDDQPVTQGIPVTAGTAYVVSAYTKAASTTIGVAMGIRWCTRLGATISETISSPTTNTTSWSRISSASLTAPSGAVFAVPVLKFNGPMSSSGGALTQYVDAVQFQAGASATTFADARRVDITILPNRTNLALNPQIGSTTNWSAGSGVGVTAVSTRLRCLATADVGTSDKEMAYQDIAVTVGDTYTFSAYLRSPATTASAAFDSAGTPKVQAYTKITWLDSSNVVLSTSVSAASVPMYYGDINKYAISTVSGTAPATAAKARIGVYTTSTGNAAITGVKPEVYMSKPLFEKAAGILPYFDGDLATVDPSTALTSPSRLTSIPTQTPTGIGVATLTTSLTHNISVGQQVTISGVTPTNYNGTWTAQEGTAGSTLVIDVSSAFGSSSIVPAITVAGIASVYDSSSAIVVSSLDTAWASAGSTNGVSYYYLNKPKVIQRLKVVIPDALPMGVPWALFNV